MIFVGSYIDRSYSMTRASAVRNAAGVTIRTAAIRFIIPATSRTYGKVHLAWIYAQIYTASPVSGRRGRGCGAEDLNGRPNVIYINCDTWGVHWLGCYGAGQVRTPNVDALAKKSAMVMDFYPQALPTVPARRGIYTGRQIFPSDLYLQYDSPSIRGWHQLYVEDVTMSESFRDAGYRTALLSDLPHQFKPGNNFHRGFDGWHPVRGNEADSYETGPRRNIDVTRYCHPSQRAGMGAVGGPIHQYLLNRQFWKTEEDWPCARLFGTAERWLENNVDDGEPFYLHIESFAPHEMWDPPEDYYRMYMKSDYGGPRLVWPPASTARLTAVEVESVRALYAGMVTFTDSRIGRFLEKVEQLGLMDNTVIVFSADHGTFMGEQGVLTKGEGDIRTQVTHIPLIVYYPRQEWAGRKVTGFAQHADVMPTLLDIVGSEIPARVTGRSLKPYLESGGTIDREWIVTGWGDHGTVRTAEWLYQGRWNPGEAYEELYDLRRDPLELTNVMPQNTALAAEMRKQLLEYVAAGSAVTRGVSAG